MKVKNEQGEEIEVFTEAEMQEKSKTVAEEAAKKAIEDFKAANPDKTAELTDLQAKLKKAEDDIVAASGGNAEQIKRLRESRDEAEKKLTEATTGFRKELDEFKKEVVGDTKTDMLDRLSNGDAELRKKIELEFDNYRPNDLTKKGITERLAKAYQLVTNAQPKPGMLDGLTGAGARGDGGGYRPENKGAEVTPNQKAIGKVLGISEADRAAHEKYKASLK